jgi:hypothetical protein
LSICWESLKFCCLRSSIVFCKKISFGVCIGRGIECARKDETEEVEEEIEVEEEEEEEEENIALNGLFSNEKIDVKEEQEEEEEEEEDGVIILSALATSFLAFSNCNAALAAFLICLFVFFN